MIQTEGGLANSSWEPTHCPEKDFKDNEEIKVGGDDAG